MNVSISNVAKAAGVSEATVSRVINNHTGVAPKTIKRVQEAISRLNYAPRPSRTRPQRTHESSAHAKTGGSRTGNLTLIILGMANQEYMHPLTSRLVSLLSKVARQAGFHLLLDEIPPGATTCDSFRAGKTDGILMMPNYFSDLDLAPILQHTPVVQLLNDRRLSPTIDHVGEDNQGIAQLACEYFVNRGCRSLVYVNHLPANLSMVNRGRFFTDFASVANLRVTHFNLPSVGDTKFVPFPDTQQITDMADILPALSSLPGPIGVLSASDDLMPKLQGQLLGSGLKVGKDVIPLSVDNCEPRLRDLDPRPDSIDLGIQDLAHYSIQLLVDRLENPRRSPIRLQAQPFLGREMER